MWARHPPSIKCSSSCVTAGISIHRPLGPVPPCCHALPLALLSLTQWYRWIDTARAADDVFRMKGILSIAHAEQRFVYHAVHMLFSGAFDDAWEDGEPRNSKMVFIGRNLDPKALADRFNACLVTKESLEAKAARLRFALGDRVECNAGEWVTGTVVAHFYRDENMPQGMVAPYQIRLDDDDGLILFGLYDDGLVNGPRVRIGRLRRNCSDALGGW